MRTRRRRVIRTRTQVDPGYRLSAFRGRHAVAVPIAATAAAARSQERLASRPDTAQKLNAQASQVVLI